ncbi:MAG: type I-U CRISPR-associated protein Csb2 [Verrucomicrobiia bacterium]
MFALGIRYLAGRAVATHPADRERAEWPPHPDRVFMALVAAWGKTGCAPDEEAALRWLESLDPPEIVASDEGSVTRREVVTTYVPVNDSMLPRLPAKRNPSPAQIADGLALLPESRPRQARHFPTVTPISDTVFLRWPVPVPADKSSALERVCRKVTYVGHSSSPVQCWLVGSKAAVELKPDLKPGGAGSSRIRLRVTTAGRFDELKTRFAAGFRPTPSLWAGYEKCVQEMPQPSVRTTCFDPQLFVLRQTGGRRFGLSATLQVTRALRDTLMAKCPLQPVPEWISGHAPDGKPSERDHIAFAPLPHVGHEHADGHLLGLALAVPRNVAADEQASCWRGLLLDDTGSSLPLDLKLGPLGVMTIELDDGGHRTAALFPETWTGTDKPARRWASVTPVAFDRHPKDAKGWSEIEATIIAACVRIGLEEAVQSVVLSPVSLFIGSPTNRGFPNLKRKAGGNIHHTHVVITFKEPVIGPVLLGAGRYRGYGLCRPLRDEEVWA